MRFTKRLRVARDLVMQLVINGRFLTQRVTGVQRYARELARALDAILDHKPEFRITVLSPMLRGADVPTWRNIELQQVGYLRGHAWEQFELPWYSRGKPLFCPGNTAPTLSLLGNQLVIVTVHDLSFKYFPEAYRPTFRMWYGLIIPLVLNRATCVITVSESERQRIAKEYPATSPRLHAIANGGLPQDLLIDRPIDDDPGASFVLYVGSLSKRKNFPRMLEVARQLTRKCGFKFVFVGDVPRTLVSSNSNVPDDVSSHVTFVGAVDDQLELISYYKNAKCLLFPSLYESSGLPPIEAMGCGCPVIASDIPALRERCGEAAMYCDPHDVESMVAAVESLMNDAESRSRLRALGYQRASTFTWERCAHETLELICQSIKAA
jgi:glycosyltransferase involved in cell wall biosynthesis